MSKVFVLDTEKRPLDPIHSAQARQLDVSQLTLHFSHHQTEYSFGGGLLEV
jgi:hypothetical protein